MVCLLFIRAGFRLFLLKFKALNGVGWGCDYVLVCCGESD